MPVASSSHSVKQHNHGGWQIHLTQGYAVSSTSLQLRQGTLPVPTSPRFCQLEHLVHFLLHLTRAPAYSLIQPLGRWLHPSHAQLHKWQAYIDLPTYLVYLHKQDIFEVYETLPPTPQYKYTRTTVSSPPPPNSVPTSQDARSFDQEPHHTSRLPQHHHPPCSTPIYNALTGGSTAYSTIPPSTWTCFVYRKQFKIIPRSLLHLTDLSFLQSEPTAGSAPYLMASALPLTMDQFSAVRHHLSAPKHMASSLAFNSYTALANTLTHLYPRKLSSTWTLPV